tara:strand:- start:992 stop:2857 length:1866 start_codon:yes stop_codon:yes gene_type:complete
MATEVDKLLIRIEADLSSVRRQLNTLDKQVQQKTRSVSNNFNRIASVAKIALGAVIVGQAARAGMALVNMASDIEEMQGKSSVVFGRFADEVRAELERFGEEVGRSRFELEAMAASIQDTFVPMGFARGEAAKLSVELTKLATDVASFNNASDTETMAAFQSALVGNHETVRRFGVVITEATLKQELLRMGIKRTNEQVTNAEKVQARLNLIMAGTTDAQGDAARTAESFANQSRALGAALQNLGAEVITPLMPVITEFVTFLTDAIKGIEAFLFKQGILRKDLETNADFMAEIIKEEIKLRKMRMGRVFMESEADKKAADSAIKDQAAIVRSLKHTLKTRRMLAIELQSEFEADRLSEEQKIKEEQARARVNEEIDKQIKLQNDLKEQLNGTTQAEIKGIVETQKLADTFQILGVSGDELKEKLAGLVEQNEKLRGEVAKVGKEGKKAFDIIEQGAVDAGVGISDALADMLVEGKSNLSSLADVFKQTMKQIIASFIRAKLIVPFLQNIGVPVSATSTGGIQFSNKAGGGAVSQPTIVGERGAELFIPHSAGVIKNNMDTKNMLGGSPVVVNQSINVDAGVAQTVRAEILTMMPMFKEQAMSAVLDARRRGGSFAATFGG